MPALPPVNKVIRIAMKGLMGEDTNIVNRWFAQYSGAAPIDLDLETLATAVLSQWVTHMASQIMAGYATESVTIEDLTSPTSAVGTVIGSHAGTDTGITSPASTAFIIQNKIARRYRGGHPRTYLAGVSVGHLSDDQTWDVTFRNQLVTHWQDFINGVNGSVWSGGISLVPVNVSYYEGFHNFTYPSGRTRPIPTLRGSPVIDAIFDFAGNPRPGSQRRRNLQGS